MVKAQADAASDRAQENIIGQQRLEQHDNQHYSGQQSAFLRQINARDRIIAQHQHSCRQKAQNKGKNRPPLQRAFLRIGLIRLRSGGEHALRLLRRRGRLFRLLLLFLQPLHALAPFAFLTLCTGAARTRLRLLRVGRIRLGWLRRRLALIGPDLWTLRLRVLFADRREADGIAVFQRLCLLLRRRLRRVLRPAFLRGRLYRLGSLRRRLLLPLCPAAEFPHDLLKGILRLLHGRFVCMQLFRILLLR